MQHRKRQITLKQCMGLCLAAFFAAFAMQLTLNGYQSRAVQAVQDAQMGCFNAISRFQGGVESSISVLENYRWENSEPEEIIDRLQSASSTCNAWLWRIGTSLNSLESVSDEQRVLYSAVDTVYQTYTGLLDELENDLLSGNDAAASQLYYAKVVPCGDYLSQYTLQLLENRHSGFPDHLHHHLGPERAHHHAADGGGGAVRGAGLRYRFDGHASAHAGAADDRCLPRHWQK